MGEMVTVRTDHVGGDFASIECDRVLVELSKDGDSPSCPWSWTWGLWLDGISLDGTSEETSLAKAVDDALGSIAGIIKELSMVRDYLRAYDAFGEDSL